MLTTDHYECTWDLLSSIPSLEHPGLSVREETVAFNTETRAFARAAGRPQPLQARRLADGVHQARPDLSWLRLTEASEETLGNEPNHRLAVANSSRPISGTCGRPLSPFQPWHSAVELKRYLHGFMNEFRASRLLGRRQAHRLQPV